ncbi:MAG: zinc ribbon domain-containing protein [Candidatus Bathyarchaeia archaeon]
MKLISGRKGATSIRFAVALALLAVVASTSIYVGDAHPSAIAQPSVRQRYAYHYDVDEDGNVQVTTRFLDETSEDGFSWVAVPSTLAWQSETSGSLLASRVQPIVADGTVNPFWANYSFTYRPENGSFDLTIQFNVSQYVYIIEPNGFFFSSEVDFHPSARGSMTVHLPPGTDVARSNITLIDYTRNSSGPPQGLSIERQADGTLRIAASVTAHSRLAVAITLPGKKAEMETITLGRFTSQTPKRYMARTRAILELYNKSYPTFRELFNVELESVNFTFFVPNLDQFRSGLGGFVPFTPGGAPGTVNVNMFYFRTVEGFIEIIALHELAHHFLWKVGVGPDKLWVHEGMAQYSSIEVAKLLGYRAGAEQQEQTIRSRAQPLGGQFGFIQDWSQLSNPTDVGAYYAASYMVFKTLGDEYGGIGFYQKAFRSLSDFKDLSDDSVIVTAFGTAAGNMTGVIREFKSWGFTNIVDAGQLKGLLDYARVLVPEVNPFLQPYKATAQWMLNRAQKAYSRGQYSEAFGYVIASIFHAENALVLTLLTYLGVVALAGTGYWVRSQLAYRRAQPPYRPLTPTVYAPARVRFCYRCGNRLLDEATFCPECGTRRLQTQR